MIISVCSSSDHSTSCSDTMHLRLHQSMCLPFCGCVFFCLFLFELTSILIKLIMKDVLAIIQSLFLLHASWNTLSSVSFTRGNFFNPRSIQIQQTCNRMYSTSDHLIFLLFRDSVPRTTLFNMLSFECI